MPKLNEMHIQKRLTTGFTFTTAITSIGAIVGIIALLFISNRYTYALQNYGFSQGDIGKAMIMFEIHEATHVVLSVMMMKI